MQWKNGVLRVIDAHVHVVPTGLPGEKAGVSDDPILALPPEKLVPLITGQMKEAGIGGIMGMGRWNAPPDDPLGVQGVLRLAALIPGLHAVGIADPNRTDEAHLKGVDAQLATGKVKAIKAFLGYLPFGPDHPNYVPYYRLAAKHRVPVIFHTGDTWSTEARLKYARPILVDDVAVDHRDTRFIMAHFGNPWLLEAAEVIYKNENVWADLSGLVAGTETELGAYFTPDGFPKPEAAPLFGGVTQAILYAQKPDRFLYGSDWPLVPMPLYRKIVAALVPLAMHPLVFRDNARALFGLD